jgi:hypothetical protein
MKKENMLATKRAAMRAKNRRFALDVHTVWLTNLSHLLEHKDLSKTTPPPERAHGLTGARDVENILKARSQIQSVSHKCATTARTMDGFEFNESTRTWEADFATAPTPPPEMPERPQALPTLTPLIENEEVLLKGAANPVLVSVHRMVTKRREYFETAAVLINGRWEIPKSGGPEHLQPGLSVNKSDDIVKLSPKKFEAKHGEETGFFSEGEAAPPRVHRERVPYSPPPSNPPGFVPPPPDDPNARAGETLESMETLDSWCATRGKGFDDVPDSVSWRISIFDKNNGRYKSVVLSEAAVLTRHTQHASKKALKYDVTRSTKPPPPPVITHRQGTRLHCKHKVFPALVTVSVTPGDGQDKSLYVEITATVKVAKKKKDDLNVMGMDRSVSNNEEDARSIITLKKRMNTIEARERLNMSR